MAARAFMGGGDLFINRIDPTTGLSVGRMGPYEADKFEIKPNAEIKEQKSKGRKTYGQVIESVPIQQPTDFTVVLNEVDKEGLTLALMGAQSVINTAAGTFTDVAIVAKHGVWVPLPTGNLTDVGFVVKNSAGTKTYVKDVDYEVNWRLGQIRALASGEIAEAEPLKVSGGNNAVSGSLIKGSVQPQLRAELVLEGVNFADQRPVIVTVFEAVLTPKDGFDFLSDKFGQITLSGRLKTPSGKDSPYEVRYLDA